MLDAASVGISASNRADYERDPAAVRAMLAAHAFEAVWAVERTMTLEQAIAYALEENVDPCCKGHNPQPLTP